MIRTSTGRARTLRVPVPSCHNGLGLGTGVLTADGELPVEYLEPGDRIVTYDRGFVPLAGIAVRFVARADTIRVRPSVLDPESGARDFVLSARQQVLIRDWRAQILWHRPIALVEARQIADGAHIARLSGARPVRLFQLLFEDRQHLIEAAGGRFLLASARMPARVDG
ncbi:MAG: Hint domain-containing protein [Maritimibacter sp.]|nr:Hint domain-containing protein [Maritimibacter sp.]